MRKSLVSICLMIAFSAAAQDSVSLTQLAGTEKMFGLNFTPAKRDSMVGILGDRVKTYNWLHAQNLPNEMPMPIWFNPVMPGMTVPHKQFPVVFPIPDNISLPSDKNQLAYYSVPQLASLIK